jgi:lipoprotein NlpD
MATRSSFPSFMRPSRALALVVALAMCASCATRRPATIEDRTMQKLPAPAVAPTPAPPAMAEAPVPSYTVKRGDTLYQIALDNGLDYRELAAWNNVENVNLIRIGQVLRLNAPGESAPSATGVTTAPLRSAPPVTESRSPTPVASASPPAPQGMTKSTPKAIKEPYSEQAVRDLTLAATARPAPPEVVATLPPREIRPESQRPPISAEGDEERLDWTWPAKGKLIAGFSETANLKGIDIAGNSGDPIVASAPGKVVYAGSGLRGYGKLIIIKHNKTYLSAYAHNREILVKEGQQVTQGQKIAEMGNTDADQVKLHFEIRRLGKPMDPVRYLPPG